MSSFNRRDTWLIGVGLLFWITSFVIAVQAKDTTLILGRDLLAVLAIIFLAAYAVSFAAKSMHKH